MTRMTDSEIRVLANRFFDAYQDRRPDELKDIFMQICDDLAKKPGWRYAIEPVAIRKKQAGD